MQTLPSYTALSWKIYLKYWKLNNRKADSQYIYLLTERCSKCLCTLISFSSFTLNIFFTESGEEIKLQPAKVTFLRKK